MLRLPRVALTIVALAWFTAACGDPQDETPSAATDATGTVTAGPTDPDQTGTATFDRVNEKLTQHGQPTLAPGTDLDAEQLYPTAGPTSTSPPVALTPALPNCGALEGPGGAAEIIDLYGPIRGGCALVLGTDWLITTGGKDGQPGVIALFHCEESDVSCLSGESPSSPSSWKVYPFPSVGNGKVFGLRGTDTLLLSGGICFHLDTREYDFDRSCWTPPTSTVGTAE